VLPQYLQGRGVPFHVEDQDTYSIVKKLIPDGQTMCSLCSRLRRGILYRVAGELGATKIALGHHRDDMVVTLLMNMFFGGRLKGMPPKLASDDGRHIVIRPLAYVAETDLERWAAHRQFPIIPCTLCGSQDSLQRVQIKAMVREWERQYPGRTDNMLHAMGHVVPSHLMDARLHPFRTLKASGQPEAGGDIAFDDDEACASPVSAPPLPIRVERG
jgi:tRNA 2-thiocytidine biosynthesis protein TtcA